MLESAIQKKIVAKLTADGWLVTKLIQTSTNGIPDLLCLKDGRAVFIEVKQPGKKPTDLQRYRIGQLQKQGFTAFYTGTHEGIERRILEPNIIVAKYDYDLKLTVVE